MDVVGSSSIILAWAEFWFGLLNFVLLGEKAHFCKEGVRSEFIMHNRMTTPLQKWMQHNNPACVCVCKWHVLISRLFDLLPSESPVWEHPAGQIWISRQGLGPHHSGCQGPHIKAVGSGRHSAPQCCSGPQAPLGAGGGYNYIWALLV